ncbi:MAG: endonuclease/exonuclease/phosphatase family protein [Bacteroidia bacterium]|nr:endonuclease/exonuclease/phosphatase family protein [Bacteroidia bacterium]
MKNTFILLLLSMFILEGFSQNNPSPSSKKVKVLSWNIYMLPRNIKRTGKMYRAPKIAEEIKKEGYDVLVFQEAFHGTARQILWRKLKKEFPYKIGPGNRKWWWVKVNSGVWILSKTPLKKVDEIQFRDCDGFVDCFARKGGLLVETTVQGQTIQIMGTHMQAGGTYDTKRSQFRQLAKELLEPNKKEGVPQLLCGDFNIREADTVLYPELVSTLQCENGPLSGPYKFTADETNNDLRPSGQKVIDFIFYKGNGMLVNSVKRFIRVFESPWHKDHKSLSDHHAVEAIFEF